MKCPGCGSKWIIRHITADTNGENWICLTCKAITFTYSKYVDADSC